MRLSRTTYFLLGGATLAALGLTAARPAAAQVDQSQTSVNIVPPYDPTSSGSFQSFTPRLGGVDFVTLAFLNAGSPVATGSVNILAGAGTGGAVLGTSAIETLVNNGRQGSSGPTVTFTFASPVTLSPGQPYTLNFQESAFGGYAIEGSTTASYAGGQSYGGIAKDLYFIEGLQQPTPPSVPEPSPTAALGVGALGLLGLSVRARRRNRAA